MNYITAITTLLLFALGACSSKEKPVEFSDLVSYGYKGKVNSVKTTAYKVIPGKLGAWEADRNEPVQYQTDLYFNQQGNLIKRIFESPATSNEIIYDYSGGIKNWKKIVSGAVNETGKIVLNNDTIIETIIRNSGGSTTSITTLDDNKRIRSAEMKGFDETGKLTLHHFITQQRNSAGLLVKQIIDNKIDVSKTEIEYIRLENDKQGNPVKTLQKKNGKPESMFIAQITYW